MKRDVAELVSRSSSILARHMPWPTEKTTGPNEVRERSWALPIVCGLLVLQLIGIVVGRQVLPRLNVGLGHGDGVAGQLLSWDGNWYYLIAAHGYAWHPPASPGNYQNIAFFPFQAMIDRVALWIAPPAAPVLVVLSSLCGGIISVFAFERLARRIMDEGAVLPAVACYAFWPSSAFYLMGYPTGIISLCVVASIANDIEGNFWRSAIWLGVGSAAAPTVVFAGAVLGLRHTVEWVREGMNVRHVPRLFLWALIALAGLLGFIVYQAIAFHSPFAFLQAQLGWGKAPSSVDRLRRITDSGRYLIQPHAGISDIRRGLASLQHASPKRGAIQIERGAQWLLNFATFVLAGVGLIYGSFVLRGRQAVVIWAGWGVFLGYEWFIFSTDAGMMSTPRLLAPGIAIFVGLGLMASRTWTWLRVMIPMFLALTSLVEIGFVASGYWVV